MNYRGKGRMHSGGLFSVLQGGVRLLRIAAFVFLYLQQAGSALAADPPRHWPWKGITVPASTAAPEDVLILKKRLGVNSLRLELNVRFIAQRQNIKPELAWAQGMDWAGRMLDACRDAGIVGIISVAQFPIDPSSGITQESPGFWNNAQQLAETLRLIGVLGEHFRNRGEELAAYELLSEPLIREGESVKIPPMWADFQMSIIRTIRKYDNRRFIVVNPPPGGSPHAYRDFKPIEDPRLIYGAHMYLPHSFTHQGIHGRRLGYTYPGIASWSYWDKNVLEQSLATLRHFQLEYNVPVWIGEFSAVRWASGAEQYLKDLTSIFNKYEWGWEYHAYQEYHGWNPDYDSAFATDSPEDWKRHYVGEASTRWRTLKDIFGR